MRTHYMYDEGGLESGFFDIVDSVVADGSGMCERDDSGIRQLGNSGVRQVDSSGSID